MPFLDKAGLAHLWDHIIAKLNTKADKEDLKQSDWNQTDYTKLDYIKNKPEMVSNEEFFNWLAEADIIQPVSTTTGELYVNNNNEIYVL